MVIGPIPDPTPVKPVVNFVYLNCMDARTRQQVLDAAHREDTYEVEMIGLSHELLQRWAEMPNSYQIGLYNPRGQMICFVHVRDLDDNTTGDHGWERGEQAPPEDSKKGPYQMVCPFWPKDLAWTRACHEQGLKAFYNRYKRTFMYDVPGTARLEKASEVVKKSTQEVEQWVEQIGLAKVDDELTPADRRLIVPEWQPETEFPATEDPKDVLPPTKKRRVCTEVSYADRVESTLEKDISK
jgi:hypothetical protein